MELELGMSLFHHVSGDLCDFITQIGKKHDSSQRKRVLNLKMTDITIKLNDLSD